MGTSREAEEMSDRLRSIRSRLARMREESRASLAQLAATVADADERASVRGPGAEPPRAADPPAAP